MDNINVERVHQGMKDLLEYFFNRYKTLNGLLAYIIAHDYGGMYIIPEEEWSKYISQQRFQLGWELREDGNIYINGDVINESE